MFVSANCWGKSELILRADQFNPLHLPQRTLMPNMDVACNDDAIAVRFWQSDKSVSSAIARWRFTSHTLDVSPLFEAEKVTSMPKMNKSNEVLFSVNSEIATEGLFQFDEVDGLQPIAIGEELWDSQSLTSPVWWRGNFLVRRLDHSGLNQLFWGSQKILDVKSENFVLFHLPQVRGDQLILVALHGQPGDFSSRKGSEILQWNEGQFLSLLKDKELDENSPWISFDVSPQPGGNGSVAFFAQHEKLGRGLFYRSPNGELKVVAVEGENSIQKLEYFAPQVNAKGDVLFRAIDEKGGRNVFFWSSIRKSSLSSVMRQGDRVELNDGRARVMDREKWPAFSGRPCLTESGQIFVHAVLESSQGGVNKGSGIFRIFEMD